MRRAVRGLLELHEFRDRRDPAVIHDEQHVVSEWRKPWLVVSVGEVGVELIALSMEMELSTRCSESV